MLRGDSALLRDAKAIQWLLEEPTGAKETNPGRNSGAMQLHRDLLAKWDLLQGTSIGGNSYNTQCLNDNSTRGCKLKFS